MEEERLRALLGEQAAAEPGLRHIVCQVDSYEQLLEVKVARARAVLDEVIVLGQRELGAAAGEAAEAAAASQPQVELEVYPSQRSHFRQRVDLWVRSDVNEALPGAVLYYAMAPRRKLGSAGAPESEPEPEADPPATPASPAVTGMRLKGFPAASLKVNALMDGLMAALNSAPAGSTLRAQLYEARFLTALRGTGPPLVTLIYHRKLGSDWMEAAGLLASALGCSLVGRSRGQKLVVGQDWIDEELHLRADPGPTAVCESFSCRHAENSFSQPNAGVNERMLEFALHCTSDAQVFGTSDLLELYCGNANFTSPLARHFRNVLATELSGPSVDLARENLKINRCSNVTVIRASDEEVATALQAEQLAELIAKRTPSTAGEEPEQPDCSQLRTLLVDPPRSGLDATVISTARRFFRYVIYISCNPTTMLRDIRALAAGRAVRLHRFAAFDQFPYTDHLECGAMLELLPASDTDGAAKAAAVGQVVEPATCPVVQPQRELSAPMIQRDKRGRTRLHLGASAGDAADIEALLREEPQATLPAFLDATDRDGCSALLRASDPGHVAVVQALLSAGAATGLQDKRGRTALHCAAMNGRTAVVTLLLESASAGGGGPFLTSLLDKHSRSALHYAAFGSSQDPTLIKSLVAGGADLELRDEYAQTPLDRAVISGQAISVKALVAAGADPTIADKYGRTALHCGCENKKNGAVVEALLQPGSLVDLNQQDRNGKTALFAAAAAGLDQMVSLLVQRGAGVDIADKSGASPLAAAAAKGRSLAVAGLIGAGADLDSQDNDGCTALHHAAFGGHGEVITALLAAGADGGIRSKNGVAFTDL